MFIMLLQAKAIDAMEARRKSGLGEDRRYQRSARREDTPTTKSSDSNRKLSNAQPQQSDTAAPSQPKEHAEVRRTFTQKRKRIDPAASNAPMMSKKLISRLF